MNFKKAIISYLPHKRTQNARNKNNILCYNEAFKGRADNAKQNRQSKKQKRGLLSWKTKTLKRMRKTTSMHILH
ncbi:type I restriction endonuclease subunit M [Helicobacter pylori]|nr:type I restriction endonuclease subunit M [Helicobacter pylori]